MESGRKTKVKMETIGTSVRKDSQGHTSNNKRVFFIGSGGWGGMGGRGGVETCRSYRALTSPVGDSLSF